MYARDLLTQDFRPDWVLEAFIRSTPMGAQTRRTWFFYETLTGQTLDDDDAPNVKAVDALDPNVTSRAGWGRALPGGQFADDGRCAEADGDFSKDSGRDQNQQQGEKKTVRFHGVVSA